MIKVIFDSNVILSAIIFEGIPLDVYDYSIHYCKCFTSAFIIQKISEKLTTRFGIHPDELLLFISSFGSLHKIVEPSNIVPTLCKDPDDNYILQLAQYVQADFIITGDKDLLVLKRFENTRIVSPREFHQQIQSSL